MKLPFARVLREAAFNVSVFAFRYRGGIKSACASVALAAATGCNYSRDPARQIRQVPVAAELPVKVLNSSEKFWQVMTNLP
jgi:hypothetical protein